MPKIVPRLSLPAMTSARSTPGQGRSTTWTMDDSQRPRISRDVELARSDQALDQAALCPSVPTTTRRALRGRALGERRPDAGHALDVLPQVAGGAAHAGVVLRVDHDRRGDAPRHQREGAAARHGSDEGLPAQGHRVRRDAEAQDR